MSVMEATLPYDSTPLEQRHGATSLGGLCRHLEHHSIETDDDATTISNTTTTTASDDSSSECDSTVPLNHLDDPIRLLKEAHNESASNGLLHQHDRISFAMVKIRHYGITIGDHPLTNLYPLTLDWSYNPVDEILSVDEYERNRRDGRIQRGTVPASRGIKAPRLTVNDRIERLVDVTGMTGRELFALERKRQTMAQEESAFRAA